MPDPGLTAHLHGNAKAAEFAEPDPSHSVDQIEVQIHRQSGWRAEHQVPATYQHTAALISLKIERRLWYVFLHMNMNEIIFADEKRCTISIEKPADGGPQ